MPKLDFDLARFAEEFDFVVREAIVPDLQATTKAAAIREMVGALVKAGAIPAASQEGIVAAILKREQLGSTAVGNGVAIPHAKHEAVSRVVGDIGWSRQGIDFVSLDGKKVHLIVLLVSPLDRAGDHLRALENISRQLRDLPRPLVTPSSET
jgi:nitrogen PTS system EIIA component